MPEAKPETKPESKPAGGWPALLASFFVLYVAFSFGLFSLPIFYPQLVKAMHWSRAEAAGGGSIVLLLIGLLSPLIGALADRYTPKLVMIVGMVLVGMSLLLLSTARDLTTYYSFCALMGVGGSAVSLVPTSMLIAPWFARNRGAAIGLINAAVGLGGLTAPRLGNALVSSYGISGAFLRLSGFLAIPLLLVLFLVPRRSERQARGGHSHRIVGAGQVLGMPMFWMFGFALFFSAHTLTAVQQHLVLYLTGHGVSASDAAWGLSILLGSSGLGKILGGYVADRRDTRASLLVSIVFLALGVVGIWSADPHGLTLVYLIAALFGLGYGGVFNAPPLISFERFGTERVGTVLGLLTMFFGLGTSSGGLVAGAIFDATHSYERSFQLDLLLQAVAFGLLVWGAKRNTRT